MTSQTELRSQSIGGLNLRAPIVGDNATFCRSKLARARGRAQVCDDARAWHAPPSNVGRIAGQDERFSLQGNDGDLAVDDIARARRRRGQRPDPAAGLRVES
jgi:hypothetical protein